ncbi:MAG: hypothetical protein H7X95_11685 [Deltaproteobacteria bacterium]|nr:hypothetical protein [Deltaproteobacteria bacterium]
MHTTPRRAPGASGAGHTTAIVSLSLSLALAVAGVLGSCRRNKTPARAQRPGIGTIEVRDVTGNRPGGAALDTDALGALIRRTLLTSGLFENAPGDAVVPGASSPSSAAVVRVKANIGIEFAEVDQRGVARAGVSLNFDTRPSGAPGAIDDDLSAGGEQLYAVGPTTNHGRLAQQLAERTVTDLLGGFVARGRLATAPPAEIHAEIVADAGRPGLREEAIRAAGVRGLRSEATVLLGLLQHENEAIRDASLGALIALRERRAVTALTRNRSLRDRHEMRKILEAVAILGGEEARDYLSFVAESHDDDEIRKLAADAKARLDRRGAN